MPEGTQSQELNVAPQVNLELSEANQQLDRVTIEPEAELEKGDIQQAEDLQKAFEDTVQLAASIELPPVEAVSLPLEGSPDSEGVAPIPDASAEVSSDIIPPPPDSGAGEVVAPSMPASDPEDNEGVNLGFPDVYLPPGSEATADFLAPRPYPNTAAGVSESSKKLVETAQKPPPAESSLDGKTHDPGDHYSGVVMTQGEIQEDKDLNNPTPGEAADSAAELAVGEAQDQPGDAAGDAPHLPIERAPEGDTGQIQPSSSGISTNQQVVMDNILGQTESVKGSIASLKMANETLDMIEELLDELQGETPVQGENESDDDFTARLKAFQNELENTQLDQEATAPASQAERDSGNSGSDAANNPLITGGGASPASVLSAQVTVETSQPSSNVEGSLEGSAQVAATTTIDFSGVAVNGETGPGSDLKKTENVTMYAPAIAAPIISGGSVVSGTISGVQRGGDTGESRTSTDVSSELPPKPAINDFPNTEEGKANYNAALEKYNAAVAAAQAEESAPGADENRVTDRPTTTLMAGNMIVAVSDSYGTRGGLSGLREEGPEGAQLENPGDELDLGDVVFPDLEALREQERLIQLYKEYYKMKSKLNGDLSEFASEMWNWVEGETKTFTYHKLAMDQDGDYFLVELTEEMTKQEVEEVEIEVKQDWQFVIQLMRQLEDTLGFNPIPGGHGGNPASAVSGG